MGDFLIIPCLNCIKISQKQAWRSLIYFAWMKSMYFREYVCRFSRKSHYFCILGVSHLNKQILHSCHPKIIILFWQGFSKQFCLRHFPNSDDFFFFFIGRLQENHSGEERRNQLLHIRNDQILYEESCSGKLASNTAGELWDVHAGVVMEYRNSHSDEAKTVLS